MFKKILAGTCSTLLAFSVGCFAGDNPTFQLHGDWATVKKCIPQGCVWQAVTTGGSESSGMWFLVTYFPNGKFDFSMQRINVPLRNIRTWDDTNIDYMQAKVRIDNQPFVETTLERELNREDRILFFSFSEKQFGDDFLRKLKKGNALRVRLYTDDRNYTLKFPLNGATAAINRIQSAMARERDDEGWGDKPSSNNQETQRY